ncbi:Na(+)/H(+) exchange regulatory cofactor NHE-RF2-like [Limulus polyphemus]|uniref:Na(+)/H(+) exchange regulatory cofactor NHE-RF2-like n=1 Tax=Limulus polyphemus TaxID=6850 RepID=A0ABM1BUV4_LIMPO|nr:Na(+)/H(+) exchange regulatory cofactor NHE-RF2-like [Limulus polyphemus]
MSSLELPLDAPAPRLCHLVKWPDFDGYGFNLHAEKSRAGQYIGKVDLEGPADFAGLREGDRIIEVNGVNIANENHKQVVERIKAIPHETRLLVLDEEGDKWYKENKLVARSTQSNVVYNKTPIKRPSENSVESKAEPEVNGVNNTIESNHQESNNNHSKPEEAESPLVLAKDEDNELSEEKQSEVEDINYSQLADAEPEPIGLNIPKPDTEQKKVENGTSPESTPKSQLKSHDYGSSHESVSSASDSSYSTKTGHNENESPVSKAKIQLEGLNLNMSASEMRQLLSARRKRDPRKEHMDMREKYHIIQQM